MITENLSTLKIHKLTKAQYERELNAGRIDENALYLTPDDSSSNASVAGLVKWRPSIDTSFSPWFIEKNGVRLYKSNFYYWGFNHTSDSTAATADTEFFLGTMTFKDKKLGYVCADCYDNDDVYMETRCNGKTYRMEEGYFIGPETNALWETDFVNKTHDVYLIVKQGCQIDQYNTAFFGNIYECMNVNDMKVSTFLKYGQTMKYIKKDISNDRLKNTATSQTINGVTFTVDDDGSITANGTATDDIEYLIGNVQLLVRQPVERAEHIISCISFKCTSSISATVPYRMGLKRRKEAYSNGYYIIESGQVIDNNDSPFESDKEYPGIIDAETVDVVFLIRAGITVTDLDVYCICQPDSGDIQNAIQSMESTIEEHEKKMEDIENYVNSQIGLAIGGSY